MSKNGSMTSLLKYRFSKNMSSKLSHNSSSSNGSDSCQENGLARDVDTSNSDSDSDVASGGSSTALAAGDPVSPVFNKKVCPATSRGKAISKNTSPWLSKAHGITTAQSNGTQARKPKSKVKYRRVRTYSTSDSDSDSTSSPAPFQSQSRGSEGKGPSQAKQWEQQLSSMFPASSPLQIQAAVAAATRARSLEAGVDYLVTNHSAIKRKRQDAESDEEVRLPKIKAKTYKRIRMVSGDSQDSQVPPPLTHDSSQDVNDTCHTEKNPLSESEKASLEFLQGAFPSLPRQRLSQVLQDCEGSTDQAVIVLSSDVQEAEQQTRPTMACASRSSNSVKREEMNLSDGEEDYVDGDDSDDSMDEECNTGKQNLILSFLEEATLAELLVLPGCSRKKAEALIKLRPFGSWEKLMASVQSSKQLSHSLVHGCYEIIQLRNSVMQLMKQCAQISEQMELVVSKLTGHLQGPQDEEDQITTQPQLLNAQFELKPYQLIGLNWLRIMHSQQLNGILADEMGLGKTVQAISFLAHLLEEGEEGPHVIIVPSSTIENWLRELSTWCPALSVIVYYGSQEERRATRHSIMYEGRDDFHVLLTTYNMATGGVEDRSLFKKFQFHYAVFDEGHMLKNMSSLRFQNLMKISAERRLLLTGTPLQNNLLELMSLLCFVMPNIFQGKTEPLKRMFSMISRGDNEQGKYEKERIAQAQRIMRPFVLRRLKKDVLTQLPQKVDEVRYCPLIPDQQDLYSSLLQKFSQEVDGGKAVGSSGVAMFMQLRKAANHPLLLRKHYDDHKLLQMARALAKEPSHRERGALPKLIMEDMAVMNDFDLISLCRQYKKQIGKFELDPSWIRESAKFRELDSLLHTMKLQNDRVLLFSQFTMMLDIVEVYLKQKDIRFLRLDGSTPVTDRQRLIDQFNEDTDIFIFLLSTRAGGLGINLTAANTIILHDIDFNPYNDKQAEDRCHRLGQKRTVKVFRLIAENTVEEGMLRCAKAKLRLERDVTTTSDDSEETQADVANLLREAISKVKRAADTTSAVLPAASASCSSTS